MSGPLKQIPPSSLQIKKQTINFYFAPVRQIPADTIQKNYYMGRQGKVSMVTVTWERMGKMCGNRTVPVSIKKVDHESVPVIHFWGC